MREKERGLCKNVKTERSTVKKREIDRERGGGRERDGDGEMVRELFTDAKTERST